ncbi:MAG: T9SS type A sorting domain-containing protein [Bacteroidetes bacterium]|nr:T9SS type A sorting domain-containing protein [Bacteroidota bacterium]MBS1973990.1 T9SS type A sorting domain-containing protein [Bacteroidota bacterium]
MKQLTLCKIFFVLLACTCFNNARAQITWAINGGATGAGNFTISGTGSVSTLNSGDDMVFKKHGSGAAIYYTCNSCTINLEITGQLVIDYPLYLFNTRIIIGKTSFGNLNTTASLSIKGSTTNPRQALFLDSSSSIQLASATNYIKLQNSPAADIYFGYAGSENSMPTSDDVKFSADDHCSLCGITSVGSSLPYTCNKGQANGPSVLAVNGFAIITPLPVVLVDFSAALNANNTVSMNWSTQIEENLSHFSVERSADGANWQIIGTVQANGNSRLPSYYSFTDARPIEGSNYYRLRMSDLDDKSGVTEMELVLVPFAKTFKIFPNPARDYVDIAIGNYKNGNVRLINQFGQMLQQKQFNTTSGIRTVAFQLNGCATGNYFVQVMASDGSIEVRKLIISR